MSVTLAIDAGPVPGGAEPAGAFFRPSGPRSQCSGGGGGKRLGVRVDVVPRLKAAGVCDTVMTSEQIVEAMDGMRRNRASVGRVRRQKLT